MVYDFSMGKMQAKALITIIITLLFVTGGVLAFAVDRYAGENETDSGQVASALAESLASIADKTSKVNQEAEKAGEKIKAREDAASHVIPHRGSSGSSLEHSLKAYDEALEAGAMCLEQDVVVSSEGTLYASHDNNAYRMTGVNKAYHDMTDQQIDQLVTYEGEKVLKLSEIFDRYGTDIRYIVELKDEEADMTQPFIDIVRKYGYEDRVTAECFNLNTLEELEKVFPDMKKMYLCKVESLLEQGYDTECVDIIAPRDFMMTQENVDRAHELGKEFSSWTLDSEEWIKKAIDLGVDSYFTDDVKLALSLEREYGSEKRGR